MSGNCEVFNLKELEADLDGFSKLAEFLRREVGIFLTVSDKNRTLLAGRLCKLLPSLGMANYTELHRALVSGRADVREVFISAITTNTTHFFREMPHFDMLVKLMKELTQRPATKKARTLRIWCAACSSGEEAYSIAMVVRNLLPSLENWNVRILASDIDLEILAKAARGVYPATALESVPQEYIGQYFERGTGDSQGFVRVRRSIRELITFAPFNLMTSAYPFQTKFDVIFCRNVMIYFDRPEIQSTIKKLESSLSEGGFLFLGHSETIMGSIPNLKSRAAAVYQKQPVIVRKGDAA